jgi:MFS family permease
MRYWVLAWLCAAAVVAYVQRTALSVPAATIQHELQIDDQLMGLVMGAWFFGYAAMQIPSGWFADRWGSRRTLAVYALAWSLLTGLVGEAREPWSLLVFWALMGMAQAGLVPCATKAIGAWFGNTERALASGILAFSMYSGMAAGPELTGWLLKSLTWRDIFFVIAVPGVLWAGAFLVLTSDVARGQAAPAVQGPVDWWLLCTNGQMHLLCAQQFLRAGAMVFFGTWFPTFLQVSRGVPQFESGTLTMYVALGAMSGCLTGGCICDALFRLTGNRRLSRQGIAVLGMTCCVGLTVLAYFVHDTGVAVMLITVGAFCATFGGVSVYPVGMEFAGKRVATVFSVINTFGNLGAALFPSVVGWYVKKTGQWEPVLFLFAGMYAAAAVCWMVLNPRGTLFQEADA